MSVASRLLANAAWRQPKTIVAIRLLATDTKPATTSGDEGATVRELGTGFVPPRRPEEPEVKGILDRIGTFWFPHPDLKKQWRYVPADFKEFPERDIKNFPHPNKELTVPPTRMIFFPDSWFKFFYDKTGETGGYLFFGGLGMYLFQKEIIAYNVSLAQTTNWIIIFSSIYYLFGKDIWNFRLKGLEKHWQALFEWEQMQRAVHSNVIKEAEDVKVTTETLKQFVYPMNRENLALQMEIAYRQRLQQVHDAVKRRLDFLVAYETTKRRFEQEHMIDWIMKQVLAGITPQMEAATMKQCITDLKALAAKA